MYFYPNTSLPKPIKQTYNKTPRLNNMRCFFIETFVNLTSFLGN